MRVLIACEFSGIVRDAFRRRGHDAWSCDLLPTEADEKWHLLGHALDYIQDPPMGEPWDVLIAHPPCTRLTNSGVRWLHERNLWADLDAAAEFFVGLLNAPVPMIAVENPIPHRYALDRIGRKYDQLVQPWMFGEPETKATCFWLKNLPLLKPTNVVEGRRPRVHHESPGPNRWKNRSRTPQGLAEAMAEQWGHNLDLKAIA